MIAPGIHTKIYLATKPVDFRKGMDGLAALVLTEFDLDPLSGAVFLFRAKRADRLKILIWDGTGLILVNKRIEGSGFYWPKISDGTLSMNKAQLEALFEGMDWKRMAIRKMQFRKR